MKNIGRKSGMPVKIGLTGGPGVGKTEVANILAKRGLKVISADALGHGLLMNDRKIKRKLVTLLGRDVLTENGVFDRQKIGMIVFNNYEKLIKFNGIIHPQLLKQLKRELISFERERSNRIIVVEAALIFEWFIAHWFDLVLVIDASREKRIERICRGGLSRRQAQRRIASQIPQKDKIALADYVIDNSKSRRSLEKSVDKFIFEVKNFFA
ncbi:MAG: dephospho-CoA kinase [candidate division Zixibacteria bacterium 4484_95]|nr:MAG: dephospho-CoA kinase [candidate division Zixibacteria bacterium 4484_95]RKX17530.1 MAG: dephospho-CoA kinase [candidate division Zixibacteria bacterium]